MSKKLKTRKSIEGPLEIIRPKLGSEGYVIEAMDARQKKKNNVIIDNEAYHCYADEKLDAYTRVTVVGYVDVKFLKLKEQLPMRITTE